MSRPPQKINSTIPYARETLNPWFVGGILVWLSVKQVLREDILRYHRLAGTLLWIICLLRINSCKHIVFYEVNFASNFFTGTKYLNYGMQTRTEKFS